MRKKVQNNPGGHTQLLAEEEGICELRKALPVYHQDELVHSPALQQTTYIITGKNPDELQAPKMMSFNRPCEVVSCRTVADDGYMTDVEASVLGYVHQNDTVGNKKDVIDGQREHQNEPVRRFRIHKRNRRGQNNPCDNAPFRQTRNLTEGSH